MNSFVERIKNYGRVVLGCLENKRKNYVSPLLLDKRKKIFIMATGPSAKQAWNNVDLLAHKEDTDYVVFNEAVWQMYDRITVLKPKIIILWDSIFFLPEEENVGQKKQISKTKKLTLDKLKQINWPVNVVIPFGFDLTIDNPYVSVVKLRNRIDTLHNSKQRYEYYDKNLLIPVANNVLQVALYYAVLNQYDEVSFIGGEYSFWKSCYIDENDNKAKVNIPHCYDEERLFSVWTLEEDGDMYRDSRTGAVSLFLRRTAESMEGFFYIREYADYKHICVNNYSDGTMLEAFKIMKFSDYIKE